jgi:putative GTP pyrophosphokinase
MMLSSDSGRDPRPDFARLQMEHEFAIDEALTKVSILRREFLHLHRYNPIEHVSSRVKTPASILHKAARLGIEATPDSIREHVKDLAGIRITCSFITDTYRVLDALTSQTDVRLTTVKDYIANPKPSGYKSLHALIEIPVFLSTGPVDVTVEVQVRTIAMDFWASLEHKISYKYEGSVPAVFAESLTEVARVTEQLDREMESLHLAVHGAESERTGPEESLADVSMLPTGLPSMSLHDRGRSGPSHPSGQHAHRWSPERPSPAGG